MMRALNTVKDGFLNDHLGGCLDELTLMSKLVVSLLKWVPFWSSRMVGE